MALSPAQLDAYAQQLGFKNYSQWSAYNSQQQAMRAPQPQAPAQPTTQPGAPPQQTNWLQNLIEQYTPLGGALKKVRSVL